MEKRKKRKRGKEEKRKRGKKEKEEKRKKKRIIEGKTEGKDKKKR